MYKPHLSLFLIFASGYASAQAPAEAFECVLDPAKVVKVASPVRGIITKVHVGRGDKVSKGQVLAQMEASVEATSVDLLKLQASDTALIAVEKEQVELSKKSYERADSLRQNSAISEQQLDELRSEYHIQEKELAKAQMDQRVAKMELKRAKAVLALRTIKSPDDGTIIEKQLSGGEFVNENTHIVTLVKLNPLHVETFVPIEHFNAIIPGNTAIVRPAPPFEGELAATITVVDPVFDAASGTFGVRLELPNDDGRLPGGLRCQVSFGDTVSEVSPPVGSIN